MKGKEDESRSSLFREINRRHNGKARPHSAY
jgi:hypothetical protein